MNDIKEEKIKSNLCATIGFLLTIFNLVVSSAFLITGSKSYLLIFSSVTAIASLILCICGHANAKKCGKGKVLSITGIIANAIILAILISFMAWDIFFLKSSNSANI